MWFFLFGVRRFSARVLTPYDNAGAVPTALQQLAKIRQFLRGELR
jgi:hypothetical protein